MATRKRKANQNTEEISDKSKTRDEWEILKPEILRLKCLHYTLKNTGKKKQLVDRLYEHFLKDNAAVNTGTNNTNSRQQAAQVTEEVATNQSKRPMSAGIPSTQPNSHSCETKCGY